MDVKLTWRRVLVLALVAWVCFTALERAFGQALRRDSLTSAIMGQLNLAADGSDKVTPQVVWQKINLAIGEICSKADAYQGIDTVVFTKGQLVRSLNSAFLRPQWMFHLYSDSVYYPMRVKGFDSLLNASGGIDGAVMKTDDRDNPKYFFFVGRKVMVYPRYFRPADLADTFIVTGSWRAPNLYQDADTMVIHPGFQQSVIDWCCWKLEEMRGNYEAAAEYRKDFMLVVGAPGVQGGTGGGQ